MGDLERVEVYHGHEEVVEMTEACGRNKGLHPPRCLPVCKLVGGKGLADGLKRGWNDGCPGKDLKIVMTY